MRNNFLNDPRFKSAVRTDYDKGHGRFETRVCIVSTDVAWLRERHPNWQTINSIIRIDSTREVNVRGEKKLTQESRYHISSLQAPKPETALQAVRDHWGIENTLHWILDMSFNEDYSRIRKENAPQIMAIIRHIALNLLQQAKLNMKRQSIKGIRKICSWDNNVLTQIISKHGCQANSS